MAESENVELWCYRCDHGFGGERFDDGRFGACPICGKTDELDEEEAPDAAWRAAGQDFSD